MTCGVPVSLAYNRLHCLGFRWLPAWLPLFGVGRTSSVEGGDKLTAVPVELRGEINIGQAECLFQSDDLVYAFPA